MIDEEEHILTLYRQLRTGMGRELLTHMLMELKFLDKCENERDMALSNYAKTLVIRVFGEDGQTVEMSKLWLSLKNLIGARHGR